MDEEVARSDVEKLREMLDCTASKSKKQKEKTEEQCITFKNLEQYPYVMRQSAWELDWDKVQALYSFHIGIPAFIIDHSIIAQWSPTASPSSPQCWTDSADSDTLYAHVVLFSLTLLNLLNAVEGREQGNIWERSQVFRVFHRGHLCPPWPGLDYYPERRRFLPTSVWRHPTGQSLQWLVHTLQTASLRDIAVLPRGSMHTVFGVAHVGSIWRSNCLTPALPRHCWL